MCEPPVAHKKESEKIAAVPQTNKWKTRVVVNVLNNATVKWRAFAWYGWVHREKNQRVGRKQLKLQRKDAYVPIIQFSCEFVVW